MRLTFSPVRMEARLTALVAGDVLTLNGEPLDFTPLPPGAFLPREAIACPWIAAEVSRDAAGLLCVPLILPHGPSAPPETLFPEAIEAADGPVALPPYDASATEETGDV